MWRAGAGGCAAGSIWDEVEQSPQMVAPRCTARGGETVLDSVKIGSERATYSKTFLDIAGARIKPVWESRYLENSQMHPVS